MRLLTSGDRNYAYPNMVTSIIAGMKELGYLVIIEGEAPGADTFARQAAEAFDIPVEKYPAKWTEHDREGNTAIPCNCPEDATRCRPAGPRRNIQMLDEGKPDVVVCFHDNFDDSRGTKHMASIAQKAGVPTYLITRLGP